MYSKNNRTEIIEHFRIPSQFVQLLLVFNSPTHQRHIFCYIRDFASWEQHTKGFGTKMLKKVNFNHGYLSLNQMPFEGVGEPLNLSFQHCKCTYNIHSMQHLSAQRKFFYFFRWVMSLAKVWVKRVRYFVLAIVAVMETCMLLIENTTTLKALRITISNSNFCVQVFFKLCPIVHRFKSIVELQRRILIAVLDRIRCCNFLWL